MTLRTDILEFLKEHKNSRQSEIVASLKTRKEYSTWGDASFSPIVCRELAKLKKARIVERSDVEKDEKGKFKVEWRLREDAKNIVKKTLLGGAIAQVIEKGSVVEASVDVAEIQTELHRLQLDRINRVLGSSLLGKVKSMTDEGRFFMDQMARDGGRSAEDFDITLIHSSERGHVKLSEKELAESLGAEEKSKLVYALFNLRGKLGYTHRDEEGLPMLDSRLGETLVILRCNPTPKLDRKKHLAQLRDRKKESFIAWLRQVKNVAVTDTRLLDYVSGLFNIKKYVNPEKFGLSAKELDEVRTLQRLYHEFSEKEGKYEMLFAKGMFSSRS